MGEGEKDCYIPGEHSWAGRRRQSPSSLSWVPLASGTGKSDDNQPHTTEANSSLRDLTQAPPVQYTQRPNRSGRH